MNETIKILDIYGNRTGLRHCSISNNSGEEFYHVHLNEKFKEALDNDSILIIDLDGSRGYSPSFIDEAFGNLVFDFGLQNVQKHLKIKSDTLKFWIERIEQNTFPLWEIKRKSKEIPKKTFLHKPWWRFLNNELMYDTWITPKQEL